MLRWERLALEVNICPQVDHLADSPAQGNSKNTANNAHGASFRKEQSLHVVVAGADGFHDSDLAPALKNCHHKRIHDADESDSQGQTPEDSEKHVQYLEELADAFAGVEDREGIEAHFLDCIFDRLNLSWVFHPHAHA